MLLALIRDRADPRVRSARQVERQTGQRVMARLPKERKFRKLRPEQLVDANPNGVYAESLRHLYHVRGAGSARRHGSRRRHRR